MNIDNNLKSKRIMNKELKISRVNSSHVDSSQVHEVLDKNNIQWNEIDCNNWASAYPYQPTVAFRLAHNGKAILLEYEVKEETVRAMADRDNGCPWEDSCCEFFLEPANDGLYYNIECNCRGALFVACGKGREGRIQAPPILVDSIDRLSSLGEGKMEERSAPELWTLSLILPKRLFFKHPDLSFEGLHASGNFYKCGDKLSKPHFLSWNAIDTPSPDFHVPGAFGTLTFE